MLNTVFLNGGGLVKKGQGGVIDDGYIRFKDPEVLRVLLANGVGADGGITEEQAAAVTSIGKWFKGNTAIETFDEFEKFESINVIGSTNENGAFDGCTNLRRIVLPTNCSIIKNQCFRGCGNLEFINLENVTEIGSENFIGTTKLTISINTPLLKSLGRAAFKNSGITSIENLGNITNLDGSNEYGTFYLCQSLQQAVLPNTLKILGRQEFRMCTALTSIVLPKSITSIGDECFSQCTSLGIDDLSLPNLETLGWNAFHGVKIKKISNLGKITALPAASANTQNFGDKSVLEEIVFPNTLTSIRGSSFQGYSKLKAINLDYIETIEGYVFREALDGVKIRMSKLQSIAGGQVFYRCGAVLLDFTGSTFTETKNSFAQVSTRLVKVVLPATLTTIGYYAFNGCTALNEVIVHAATPPTMTGDIFAGTNNTFLIYVPDASVTAYREASGWVNYADRIKPLSEYTE